jgi:hypothetical protein
MRFTGPYKEHTDELAQAYDQWFEAAIAAQLLASQPLQDAIQKARFAAARYQETHKPYANFHAWMNDVEIAAVLSWAYRSMRAGTGSRPWAMKSCARLTRSSRSRQVP